MSNPVQPEIQFIPISTNERTIRFFGTLMPALLLFKSSPVRLLRYQVARHHVPHVDTAAFIRANADDAARVEDMLVFVHRWQSLDFDPFAFAQAKTFLARIVRLVRRAGYSAEPLAPLSPSVNLPRLAARAGLGDLSPFGLLVHPAFGPRLILTALRTNYRLAIAPRWQGEACTTCMACIDRCPQEPLRTKTVELRACQSCAECLAVCQVGRGNEIGYRAAEGTRVPI